MAQFVTVGKAEEFPKNVMRTFKIGEDEVVVCNAGRQFYAFLNVCSHRAERLSDGLIEDDTVVCAYHEAVFEMGTGRPIEGPAFDPVRTFTIRVEGDAVQVEAADDVDASTVHEVVHEAGYVGD